MDDKASAGVRTVQDLVRALAPSFGTGLFTKREERVLAQRIAHDQTLLETARFLARVEGIKCPITRERVRQIEAKALRKWKHRHLLCQCPHCGKEILRSANGEHEARASRRLRALVRSL